MCLFFFVPFFHCLIPKLSSRIQLKLVIVLVSNSQMASTSEHSCPSMMSDVSSYLSCQKSSDVKFAISALKKNVMSVSNSNILQTESNEIDDDGENIVNESKRQRLTLMKNGQIVEYVNYHFSNFWY